MYLIVQHNNAGGNELWCRKSCCGIPSHYYSAKKKNNSGPCGSLIKLSVKNPLTSIPDGLDVPWNWMSHVKLAPCLFSANSSCKGEKKINLAEKSWEQQDVFHVK